MLRYVSTRGNSGSHSFLDILLEGLAPDGGLYVPTSYPELDLNTLRGASYVEVAFAVLSALAPDMPQGDLRRILEKTYTAQVFGSDNITPVTMLDSSIGLLQLSNGPTFSFKDVALQLVGNLMEYALARTGGELNVLGATSGDTGSAAAYALKGKRGINLFMLSPKDGMSEVQKMQMYSLDEPNIFNIVVNSNFDGCQAIVKEVNRDATFKSVYKIGAVNSINWARIAAQMVYCVYGYLQATTNNHERVTYVVPSGNFGHAFSAYGAQRMGVPIDIVVATNENDVLNEVFGPSGTYRPRENIVPTSSPSMDIVVASNFERLVYELADQSPSTVRRLWKQLEDVGEFNIHSLFAAQSSRIRSGRAMEDDVLDTIRNVYNTYGVIIDPHTAEGMHVARQYQRAGVITLVAETAQAAKFGDTIQKAIGVMPPLPKALAALAGLPEHVTRIEPDAQAVKNIIAAHLE